MPVGESRSIEGVDFVLPEPRVVAHLRILVVGPDGAAYKGATASLANPAGFQRWHSRAPSDDKGEIVAQVYVGERYTVSVSHYTLGRKLEGSAEIAVDGKDAHAIVVLREEVQGRK